jgi:WD40 repeat protein
MAGDSGISAVQIWDLGPNGDAEWVNLAAHGADQVEFMPDGRRVVTSSEYGPPTIWDLQTGRDLRTIEPTAGDFWIESFDVSPDGSSIAVGGWIERDNSYGGEVARVLDVGTGKELFTIRHPFDVKEIVFSPDGEHLVTSSWGRTKIMDRVGHVVRVLREDGVMSGVRFSADGLLVATVSVPENSARARVTIWDWAAGEVVRTIQVGRTIDDVYGVAFDPSGPRIAVSGSEGPEIWDVDGGTRPLAVLQGPSGGATDLAFSPDGSRVAVANADGTVRLFEADTGAQQLFLQGRGCPVSEVAFSPDGTKLASASPCDGARICALDIDDLLEIARREARRSLTDEECRQYLHVDQCPQA